MEYCLNKKNENYFFFNFLVGEIMDDLNLKLILKSELKVKMPSYLFKELLEEIQLTGKTLSKTEKIDVIFKRYSIREIIDLILNKYEGESQSIRRRKFLNRINGLSIDERKEKERKEEAKRKKGFSSPSTSHPYRPYLYYGSVWQLDDGYRNIYFED